VIRRWLPIGVGVLLAALGAGFTFYLRLTASNPAPPRRADGIVVLTGGPERIETGLRLLAEGRAPRLLVSGVGQGVELPELVRRAGADAPSLAGRVTLGRMATTTHTNAAETGSWVRAQGVRSLIVVTADFHMPRALVELGRAMPDVVLHPVPVPSGQGAVPAVSWRRLGEEYVKWVLTLLGLSGYAQPAMSGPATGATDGPWLGRVA